MQSSTSSTRFWAKVRKAPSSTACWEWQGEVAWNGYGTIRVSKGGKRSRARAHRLAYEFHYGVVPPGMHVLHTCDNRLCVRPEHLFVGTNLDNVRDRQAKGRRVQVRRPGSSKLTEMQVREILSAHGARSVRQLAADYGVSYLAVYKIIKRQTWKHLPAPAAGSPQ